MILLRITPYGWALIAAILLSLALTRGVVRRMSPKENAGCLSFGYTALIISILMIFVLTFSVSISQSIYGFFTKPKYQATVTSFSSHWEDRDEKDSNGRSRKTKVLMHTPTVQFTDQAGNVQLLETDIASGAAPVIGSTIKVVYAPGDTIAHELSFASIALLFGASLMIFIMGLILFAAIQYARGVNMGGITAFGLGFLMRFLFPFGMLFLLGGMGYALFQYFTGHKPDMPLWAVIVCCFFCLVLLMVIPVFLKMVYGKEKKIY